MSSGAEHDLDRLDELVSSDWEDALSPEEQTELAALVRSSPAAPEEVERAAAAVAVAFALADPDRAEMPPEVAERIRANARAQATSLRVVRGGAEASENPSTTEPTLQVRRNRASWGWPLAFAAASVAAIAGWLPRLAPTPPPPPIVQEKIVEVAPPPPPPPTERLADLRTGAEDARAKTWTATDDPYLEKALVLGEVVWSNTAQEGYMVFRGLPANDPTEHRYQLWIFDQARDEAHPVDGGVFDIASAGGEAVVPIDPKLEVLEPKMFAVTLEGPNGVVVSKREHILVVAQLD